MTIDSSPHNDIGSPDLLKLLTMLAARRWWLLASVVVSTVFFATAALVIKPTYRVTTLLVPASGERNSTLNSTLGQLGSIAAIAGFGGSADVATEEALAVIKSREFTERFISEMNLMPELFASRWNAARGEWKSGSGGPPTSAKAYKYFSRVRTVSQDKKTGLVSIQIEWNDPKLAADWANELANRINSAMRTRAIEKASASVNFLEKELSSTGVLETREAINRLLEGQVKQRMLANVTHEYAFRVVDKAMAPDIDDPVRPQKLLLFMLGPLVGLASGIVMVLAFELLLASKKSIS